MLDILNILVALCLLTPAHHEPKPPQGWVDCGFDQQNEYRCKT